MSRSSSATGSDLSRRGFGGMVLTGVYGPVKDRGEMIRVARHAVDLIDMSTLEEPKP